MSAKDVFHNAVKNALQKEGWIITDDPLFIRFGGINIYIDLGEAKVTFQLLFKMQFTDFAVG